MTQPNRDEKSNSHAPAGSRREFLTGMGAIKAIQENAEKALDANDWSPHDDETAGMFEQYSKSAMACRFEVSFNLHQNPQASPATMLAFQLIDDLEQQLTVYRDDSEVSQLNSSEPNEWRSVESRLFELLQLAVQIHDRTNGAFDITAGHLSKIWGFEARQGRLPETDEIEQALSRVGSQRLKFDLPNRRIAFDGANTKINLGGIGKGYALDRVAELFEERGVVNFSIHGGQSSVLARGNGGSNFDGWLVGITHPTVPGIRLGTIRLTDQALGTSGTARQGFFHKGQRFGHIIDPRSGWPTNHHLSTTVVSPSAAISDALATAFFVMETEQVQAYCDDHPDTKVLLVQRPSKTSGHVKVIAFNFDDEELSIFE